ncbi:hypothetical protein PLESTM_000764000 [Pleodorina starrii]|nr:hypothetical protein PLESTM_000764000 [Pleodorina starrii]
MEVALDSAGLPITTQLQEAAAAAGHLHINTLLHSRGCPWDSSLGAAARGGHQQSCEKMLASGCPFRQDAVYEAASGGHEVLMYWLLWRFGNGPAKSSVDAGSLLMAAAEGLRLASLQRLHQRTMAGWDAAIEQPAALDREQKGRVLSAATASLTPDWQAKVEWLEGLGYPRTGFACEFAAARLLDDDAVDRLQWLCGRGYPPSSLAADCAVVTGNLAALSFLMQQRPGLWPREFACNTAAEKGHLPILQHLHTSGFPVSPQQVARSAAGEGHLHVVAWAVEALNVTPNNAPDLFDMAAKGANIALLTWLRERGWTWGPEAVSSAAEGGCEEALEWLVLEQGCPLPADGRPYRHAARHGDLATVRCLHRLGCPWGPHQIADCIAHSAPIPVLRCLVELGCPVDWEEDVRAAKAHDSVEYHTALMEWLQQ